MMSDSQSRVTCNIINKLRPKQGNIMTFNKHKDLQINTVAFPNISKGKVIVNANDVRWLKIAI